MRLSPSTHAKILLVTLENELKCYEHISIICRQAATLREESSRTNVILQYKLLSAILSAVCSVIQQS